MNERSIFDLVRGLAQSHANQVAYRFKRDESWHDVTWAEHERTCLQIARSILALGVQAQQNGNILSQTRLEWIQCDLAMMAIGVVTAGIYPTNLADECAFIVNHSESPIIFVENQEQLDKIAAVRAQLPHLQKVIAFEPVQTDMEDVLSWDEFLALADGVDDDTLQERMQAVTPDDLATIVYTSGTTGVPKGAMLTHENVLFTSDIIVRSLKVMKDVETLLFLPLAHIFARMIVFASLRVPIIVSIAENIQKVPENIREIRPHFIASAPRIYEKIYERIQSQVANSSAARQKIFRWALRVGEKVSRCHQQKQPVSGALALRYKLATKLVFAKIQQAFGGRLLYAISGAAPLNPKLAEFFHACGILILEGIGMTENTSFTNVNRFDNYKFGTVGQPGPDVEQRVAEDGELLYRGKNLMRGYYKNPEATAEAIDKDGWLHTGDIGEIDDEGFVTVTDRKKDLIITAGGKNIAPQRIERYLRTSRFISQAVAIGDRRKFLVALLTLNMPEVETWATQQGIEVTDGEALVEHPEVIALVQREIDHANAQLASYETIKKFRILPQDFTIESGELTPTLKVKRRLVTERYSPLIDDMYRDS